MTAEIEFALFQVKRSLVGSDRCDSLRLPSERGFTLLRGSIPCSVIEGGDLLVRSTIWEIVRTVIDTVTPVEAAALEAPVMGHEELPFLGVKLRAPLGIFKI
jgi:hypothetical protein